MGWYLGGVRYRAAYAANILSNIIRNISHITNNRNISNVIISN